MRTLLFNENSGNAVFICYGISIPNIVPDYVSLSDIVYDEDDHCTKKHILSSKNFPVRNSYHLCINFLAYKRLHFSSPESSKQELFSNQ